VERLAPGGLQGAPAPARASDLAALGGQPDIGRALVAGDDLDRQAERRLERPLGGVVPGRPRRHSAHLYRRARRHPLLDAIDPARLGQRADRVLGCGRPDVFELPRVELDALLAEDLTEEQPADEVAEGEAVGLGDLVEIVGGDQASRAGHVLDDDRRVARNVPRQMPGDRARVGVEASSRREAHDDADGLALVEGLLGPGGRGGCQEDETGGQDHQPCHVDGPSAGAARRRSLSLARHTRSGVIGRSVILTPIARAIALATAGAVGMSPLSPIPLAPYGPGPSPFSTRMLRYSSGRSLITGTR